MSLFEHIAELRTRLVRSVLAIVVAGTVVFVFYDQVLHFLAGPYRDVCAARNLTCPDGFVITGPLDGVATRMKVSGYGGLALAMPVVLWQLWKFVQPGLHKSERKYALPFTASATTLFLLGAAIAFWTMPKALDFLISFGGPVQPLFTPNEYVSLVVLMMVAFGIGFEFPVLLVFLELVKVVTPAQLVRARRYSIVGIFVVVAVGTPSGDPYSLLALSIPLVIFYELAIVIGKVIEKRRLKAQEATVSA